MSMFEGGVAVDTSSRELWLTVIVIWFVVQAVHAVQYMQCSIRCMKQYLEP